MAKFNQLTSLSFKGLTVDRFSGVTTETRELPPSAKLQGSQQVERKIPKVNSE